MEKCGHFNIIDSCEHCQKIQKQWYGKLNKKKFNDIEDPVLRILKKWTGISNIIQDENSGKNIDLFDILVSQQPNTPIESSWPETKFSQEINLLNNVYFESICETLFNNGNNVVSKKSALKIWRLHCDGFSVRAISKEVGIYYASVFRAIKNLREVARFMDDSSKIIIIRDYNPGMDAPLLFSSWRNCLWFDAHPLDTKPNPTFFRMTTKKIHRLLKDPNTKVRIACLEDDPNAIKGYVALNNDTIEFVYVKADYRKEGIATLLTKGFKNISNTCTKIGKAIALKKNLKIKENQDGREEAEENQRI